MFTSPKRRKTTTSLSPTAIDGDSIADARLLDARSSNCSFFRTTGVTLTLRSVRGEHFAVSLHHPQFRSRLWLANTAKSMHKISLCGTG
jgi:hypothetical protein